VKSRSTFAFRWQVREWEALQRRGRLPVYKYLYAGTTLPGLPGRIKIRVSLAIEARKNDGDTPSMCRWRMDRNLCRKYDVYETAMSVVRGYIGRHQFIYTVNRHDIVTILVVVIMTKTQVYSSSDVELRLSPTRKRS
jgi:hypothetical protein